MTAGLLCCEIHCVPGISLPPGNAKLAFHRACCPGQEREEELWVGR